MVAPMLRGTLVLVTIFSVIGEQSQTYTQRQTPGVPTSPQIDGALLDPEMGDSHRILLLSWTAPSSNAGPVLGYRLLCQTDGEMASTPVESTEDAESKEADSPAAQPAQTPLFRTVVKDSESQEPSYRLNAVEVGHTYSFKVAAHNIYGWGTFSQHSATVVLKEDGRLVLESTGANITQPVEQEHKQPAASTETVELSEN